MCACSESEVGPVEQRILAGHSDLRSFSPPDFAPIRRHPQQPRGSKRMLAVCRAGSKVTEVLAQYAGLSHRPSMTKRGDYAQNPVVSVKAIFQESITLT